MGYSLWGHKESDTTEKLMLLLLLFLKVGETCDVLLTDRISQGDGWPLP